MENERSSAEGFSHMAITASLSVVVLLGVVAWQTVQFFTKSEVAVSVSTPVPSETVNPFEGINWQSKLSSEAGTDSVPVFGEVQDDVDGLSNIAGNVTSVLLSSYATLQEAGAYSPDEAERIAGDVAASLRARVSYTSYTAGDVATTSDTSYEGMLAYRGDMQVALEPLLKNTEYEFGVFAKYIDTGDKKYVVQLEGMAGNYRAAIASAAKVVVPADAASRHADILNALSEFAATVDAMAAHADDPFAGAALLQSFNSAEERVVASFNALAEYSKNKSS